MEAEQREILICSYTIGRSWRAWLEGCKQAQDLQLLSGASLGSLALAQKELCGCGQGQGPMVEVYSAHRASLCLSLDALLQNLADLGLQLTC